MSNRDGTAKLPLNRAITAYSAHADEQIAYERMQQASFRVAEFLMQQPHGAMAVEIQGHAYWVSPLDGMMEVFCTPDYDPVIPDDCNLFAVSDFQGQSVEDLDACRRAMEMWLLAPKLVHREGVELDAMVHRVYGEPAVERAGNDAAHANSNANTAATYGPELVTKVTQILQRANGSEVRIVAQAFLGAGLHRSVGVYVHKRESKDHEWILCSDRPASDWRSMSVAEYKERGRSPMLQAASPGEVLRAISAIGRPIAEFQDASVDPCESRSDYPTPRM